MKIQFQQRRVKLHCLIDKMALLLQFFTTLILTRSYYLNVLLPICNNFSERNYLDKPVFNSVSRLNYSFSINNAVTIKINHFPRLFVLGPQIALKWKWHYFLDQPLLQPNLIYTFISIKIIIFSKIFCKLSAWWQ